MRRKEQEITDIDEIEKIIGRASSCRIGLVDGGEPYVVPVCFGYERNTVYFHSAPEGRKVEIIQQNGKACFEVTTDEEIVKAGKPCKWSIKYRSVIGKGTASVLEGDEEKTHALRLIMRQYGGDNFDFARSSLDSTLIVKIAIESLTGKQSGY